MPITQHSEAWVQRATGLKSALATSRDPVSKHTNGNSKNLFEFLASWETRRREGITSNILSQQGTTETIGLSYLCLGKEISRTLVLDDSENSINEQESLTDKCPDGTPK